jgi:hypothetical protein
MNSTEGGPSWEPDNRPVGQYIFDVSGILRWVLCSQEPAICPYPKLAESNPHPPILFL